MPGLSFSIEGAEPLLFAASPTISFGLRVTNPNIGETVQSVALRSQIMIEAPRRQYAPEERKGVRDLFGEPDRWKETLRPFLWTHVSTAVPSFTGTVLCEIAVPCTFDFNVAAAKYFYSIHDGDIPLVFQFSGTTFYARPEGGVQVAQISWKEESRFRLPAGVWHGMMDHYYPNSTWLRLQRDTFDRLHEFKIVNGLATWEQAIESLLQGCETRLP